MVSQVDTARLIANMAQLDVLRPLLCLQREAPVIVGHRMYVFPFSCNADMTQRPARLFVEHHATDGRLRLQDDSKA